MAPFKRYEQLSELVKMYPCLYNKQEKDFKKEEVKQSLERNSQDPRPKNGKVVEQLWNNFLKNALQTTSKAKRSWCISCIRYLVIISVWWEWVGDRNLLGDISPSKCCYCLGIKVTIVLTSISKKVSPVGKQT